MISEAISKIQGMALLAKSELTKVHGLVAFQTPNGVKIINPPLPDQITVNTLDGISQYLEAKEVLDTGLFIVIDNHEVVNLLTCLNDYQKRSTLISCQYNEDGFRYGSYFPVEEFIINVQTKFEEGSEKTKLIDFVSAVKGDTVMNAEDNGIAQKVTVVNKVGRLDDTKTDPIVRLRPFRTFHELEQPESPFLLRMKVSDGNTFVALHEADNGRWKTDAINKIREYLLADPTIEDRKLQVIG